jgi:glycerol-3-phosphate acyltransferase PlsX
LGLKGISVKSHGSADVLAFGNALSRAYDAAENGVLERIAEMLASQSTVPVENV